MQDAAIRQRVMIEAVWPKPGIVREVILILGGSLLLALTAQIQVLLPISPVPITGQTFGVLLLASLYGSRRGPATVVTYLLLGGIGLPFFAGGASGAARLVGPTAGYLVGFIVATYAVGLLAERGWDRRPATTAASMVIGNLIIYLVGAAWLSRFVGWSGVLSAGVLPFLAGDAVKILLATLLLPAGWKIIGRTEG